MARSKVRVSSSHEARFSVRSGHDRVSVSTQQLSEHLTHFLGVVDHEDLGEGRRFRTRWRGRRRVRGGSRRFRPGLIRFGRRREPDREDGSPSHIALHAHLACVPIHDGVGAAQAKAFALLPLRGEEGIEDVQAHLLSHAYTRIGNLTEDPAPRASGPKAEGTPLRHRVQRIESDRGQDLPELGRVAHDGRHGARLAADLAGDPAGGELLRPARSSGSRDLLHELVQIHELEGTRGPRATEVLEPPDDPGALERHLFDHAERAAHIGVLHVGQQELGTGQDAGERVVEVVRHFTCHLPERPEPFLLHRLLMACQQTIEDRANLAER